MPIATRNAASITKKPKSHPITVGSRGPIGANVARRIVNALRGAATNEMMIQASPPCVSTLMTAATAASAKKHPRPNKNPRFTGAPVALSL